MGSWDCYCAICGGPFVGVRISQIPRTSHFLVRRAKEELEQQKRKFEGQVFVSNTSEDDEGEDCNSESPNANDEYGTYDCDIVSEADIKWIETLHVIGANDAESGVSKVFISGPGRYLDYGGVNVEAGSDPNIEGADVDTMSCYRDDDNEETIFPFHWPCYELLTRCITGSFAIDQLDKDILFSVMRDLGPDIGSSLELDYGAVSLFQGQYFETCAGYEFIVSHPRDVPGIDGTILAMLEAKAFKPVVADVALAPLVQIDPFMTIPYDNIHQICTFLAHTDVVNLSNASWPVHRSLRKNDQFWRARVRTHLPWFFELHNHLNRLDTMFAMCDLDFKKLFLWAEKMTRPKRWTKVPWMGMAKRRNTWEVCEQLKEKYLSLICL
ncbi:hypothetical protein N0V93_002377 [Gnomoniopsis smithogilvyi]|uniref:F-box domain-containing protein n=1 Tax=Gnomoniopsis smithogilvyi TaxID=1191159 RepID=A0A9W8YYN9_9PEZI|nr:hypothetical protein N0V93_002377 [Gnomoniopsis smithogilvyi]